MSLFSGMKLNVRSTDSDRKRNVERTSRSQPSSDGSTSVSCKEQDELQPIKTKPITDYADCTEEFSAEIKRNVEEVETLQSSDVTRRSQTDKHTETPSVGDTSDREGLSTMESDFIESLDQLGKQLQHVHTKYSSDLVGLDLGFQQQEKVSCNDGDYDDDDDGAGTTQEALMLQETDTTTQNDEMITVVQSESSNCDDDEAADSTLKTITSGFSFIQQQPLRKVSDDNLNNDDLDCDIEVIEDDESVTDLTTSAEINKPCYVLQLTNKEEEELLLQTAEANIQSIREEIANMEAQQENSIQNHQKQNLKKIQTFQKLKALQNEQSQALVDEDFEKAEDVDKKMQLIEDELNTSSFVSVLSLEDVRNYLEKLTSLYEKELTHRRGIHDKITAQKKEREVILEQDRKRFVDSFEKEKQEIEKETNQLEKAVSHLSIDREHLEKSQNNLEAKISDKISTFVEKKQVLLQEMTDVQTEIANLERKLIAMREKEKEIASCIELEDSKIDGVKGEFREEREKLEEERNNIEQQQIEINNEVEKVHVTEKELMEKKREFEINETRCSHSFEETERKLAHESQAMAELIDIQEKLAKVLIEDDWPSLHRDKNESLQSMKEKVDVKKVKMKDKMATVLKLQTSVTTMRVKINDIEEQIQNLNEAKKLAVAGRNFVEAKRLANEVKECTSEGQGCQKLLESMIEELTDNNKTLEKLQEDYKSDEAELEKQELEFDLQVKENVVKVAENVKTKLQNQDLITPHRCILEAQMNACYFVIKDICLKHEYEEPSDVTDYFQNLEKIHSCDNDDEGDDDIDVKTRDNEDELSMETANEILRLEELLQEAVEKEDYDAAEELNTQIENLKQAAEVT